MFAFTPFSFTAGLIRTSGAVWARNLRCLQVFMDAAVAQQLTVVGRAHPVAALGVFGGTGRVAAKKAALGRTPRKPSTPHIAPATAADLDDSDVPV
ncbi:hypothetical protein [Primorskyibacter sp. 2E233]|uniref:hypothetical protein n=1 Tax=Primorskyibacter sp. 2E233 TaxID=3413431 RepID=UPI003BF13804